MVPHLKEKQNVFVCYQTFLSLWLYLWTCCSCHSAKFSSKIKYVNSLDELQELIPMDIIQIPECIIRWVPLSSVTLPLPPSSMSCLFKLLYIHLVIWTLTSRLDKELKESADNSRWILTLLSLTTALCGDRGSCLSFTVSLAHLSDGSLLDHRDSSAGWGPIWFGYAYN